MGAWVVADNLHETEGGCDNGHDEEMRYDGLVPTLTPVHQQESSSLASDAG